MEWFGRADISFIHAASTRIIRKKDGSETDLLEICEQCTPPCRLNPLLFNGHLQTVWTLMKPHGPKVYYKRRIFEANNKIDSGTFAVDFAVGPFEGGDPTLPQRTMHFTDDELQQLGSNDERPMLVVLHGLSGGSHEAYLRLSIAPLLSEGGWEVCVVNSRGCAQSKITSGVLYNARATWDIRQTVRWLSTTFPNRPLFGMGFSLGANILTNYCGEEGPNCLLNGVVVCSNPFNLEISSKMLQSTYVGREVYSRKMSLALKELLRAHREELKRWSAIDVDAALKATYLNEFDRLIQCPSWGYPTEDAYYRDASSTDAILNIKIPFFAINSTDDPIAVKEALPLEEIRQNPNTLLLTTSLGGHLSWSESNGGCWFTKPVTNFLRQLAFNIDLGSLRPQGLLDQDKGVKKACPYDPMRRKMQIDLYQH